MKRLLEILAFVLIAQGAGSLVHEYVGWFDKWTLLHRVGFLDGYRIYVEIGLIVLGLAVGAASDAVKKP